EGRDAFPARRSSDLGEGRTEKHVDRLGYGRPALRPAVHVLAKDTGVLRHAERAGALLDRIREPMVALDEGGRTGAAAQGFQPDQDRKNTSELQSLAY